MDGLKMPRRLLPVDGKLYKHHKEKIYGLAWRQTEHNILRHFLRRSRVYRSELVFSLKPMTTEKKAQGLIGEEYAKARICTPKSES